MKRLILIVTLLLVPLMASADDNIYAFETPLGKAVMSERNPDIIIFHTYEGMTTGKDVIKGWQETKGYENKLTKKAKDLHDRLYKLEDVAGVFVSYRNISVQKFPLVEWAKLIPQIEKILK